MAGTKRFDSMPGLSPETVAVLAAQGFVTATPVQEATIPLFAGNKDVAVDACTGSGKTLAFVIPIIEKMRKLEQRLKPHQVAAIIVSPTRELAKQIHTVAQPFVASVPGFTSMLLVGGTDPAEDVAAFRTGGAHLLVGTPGRIDDIMKRCTQMDCRRLEVLVLDEADRLLDMGFQRQLDALMGRLPKQRRTGLFSATQTDAVSALMRAGLRNPVRVNVAVAAAAPSTQAPAAGGGGVAAAAASAGDQRTPSTLTLQYVVCEADEKLGQLVRFLQLRPDRKVIVYFLTCACVEFYAAALKRLGATTSGAGGGDACEPSAAAAAAAVAAASGRSKGGKAEAASEADGAGGGGVAAAERAAGEASTSSDGGVEGAPGRLLAGLQVRALHGRMKQAAREATLSSFTALPAGALLCTDVAARGLDIPDVHWIVQFDPPQDPAAFVHRVGRTARMGRSGASLALLLPSEEAYVDLLRLRRVPLQPTPPLAGAPRSLLPFLRSAAERDRDLMERGTRAYVSFVRGYKEHQCKFIFRVQDLPLGRLASSLALLRLPRMPEVKKALGGAGGARLPGFEPSEVDPETVTFAEKAREKQRQQGLKAKAAAAAAAAAAGGVGGAPAQRLAGSAREQAAAAAKRARAAAAAEVARLPAAKRRHLQQRDELAELAHDYGLLRKLKRGKISQREFDVAAGLSSSSDEEGGDGGGGGEAGRETCLARAAHKKAVRKRRRQGQQPAAKGED